MENSKPTMPERRSKFYRPLLAIVITIGIYFVAQIISGLVLSLIPLLLHWTPARSADWIGNNTGAQFIFIVVAEVLTLYMLWQALKKRGATWLDIGFNKPQLKYLAYAVSAYVLYMILYVVALSIASKLIPALNVDQKQELGFNNATHGTDLWLIFISLVILPPLVEEIVVRGFLYTNLRTRLIPIRSALIASLLFGAAHLAEGGKGGLLWVAAIDTFILSMVLCYLRERTKSLWPGIGVHMIKNGLAFVLLFNIVHII